MWVVYKNRSGPYMVDCSILFGCQRMYEQEESAKIFVYRLSWPKLSRRVLKDDVHLCCLDTYDIFPLHLWEQLNILSQCPCCRYRTPNKIHSADLWSFDEIFGYSLQYHPDETARSLQDQSILLSFPSHCLPVHHHTLGKKQNINLRNIFTKQNIKSQ